MAAVSAGLTPDLSLHCSGCSHPSHRLCSLRCCYLVLCLHTASVLPPTSNVPFLPPHNTPCLCPTLFPIAGQSGCNTCRLSSAQSGLKKGQKRRSARRSSQNGFFSYLRLIGGVEEGIPIHVHGWKEEQKLSQRVTKGEASQRETATCAPATGASSAARRVRRVWRKRRSVLQWPQRTTLLPCSERARSSWWESSPV